MKIFKNRFVIGTICIIAGLLISFFALPVLQGNSGGEYTNAVRAVETVQSGTQIEAYMVETVRVLEGMVQGSIDDKSLIVGRYANTRLYTGDYLTNTKLSEYPSDGDVFAAGTLKGKEVVSVTLPSLASSVSGRLLPGDVVTVIAQPSILTGQALGTQPTTVDTDVHTGVVIYPELRYLEVCMVSAGNGSDADVNGNPAEDEKNELPVTVSFFVNESQALLLAELEQQGAIHLAFVARGEASAIYIPDEERVFNTEVD